MPAFTPHSAAHNMKSYTVNFIVDTTQFGNPMAKLKMTGKQFFLPKAQKYVAFKSHILVNCLRALDDHDPGIKAACLRTYGIHGAPFHTTKDLHAYLVVKSMFKNNAHADPENVYGTIADSLFKSDKYLRGEIDFGYNKDKTSHVEVEVTFFDAQI